MVRPAQVRRMALALADATEQDHHGFPSFRVGGKIFATLPDEAHLNVMVDEGDVHAMVAMHWAACEALWWGRRLRGVRVNLAAATPRMVAELLEDAWRRRTRPAARG
jgi:hypothetical protein